MFRSAAVFYLIQEESQMARNLRRNLRDCTNPLELPQALFNKYYRVNKEMFTFLLNILSDSLPPARKPFAVSPIVMLSATLRFFAEGGYQTGVGKDFEVGLAQSTFSECLSKVLNIFEEKLCDQWIRMQVSAEDKRATKTKFFENFRLPGVIGCIDGTHIKIIAPRENKHAYYNRKGYFSLNVLIACDDEMRIRCVDASHAGSCHDSLIWRVSQLRSWMEENYLSGERNSWLLGDSGYPLEPWLLTPHRQCLEGSPESKFNEVHKKCRNIVERTIGVLKNRWRCLLGARELHYMPAKAIQIVNVCCALHNMCIHFKANSIALPLEGENNTISTEEFSDIEAIYENSNYNLTAQRIRSEIGISL